jgi:hypothetical protein
LGVGLGLEHAVVEAVVALDQLLLLLQRRLQHRGAVVLHVLHLERLALHPAVTWQDVVVARGE